MKQSVNFSAFVDAFRACNRYDQFGYDALSVLFDYLESYEEDTGEELELDVIALCCDYSVDSVDDIASRYGIDFEGETDPDVRRELVLDFLNDNGAGTCGVTPSGQIVYCSAFRQYQRKPGDSGFVRGLSRSQESLL